MSGQPLTCAVCEATITLHPIIVRTVDDTGVDEQHVCSCACASTLTSPES
jgi:hypothetical protein